RARLRRGLWTREPGRPLHHHRRRPRVNASSQLPPGRRSSGSAVAARFFYRQLFIRRPLALGLVVVPLAMLLLGLRPGAVLACIFSLGSLPALGATLMPPHLPVSRRQLLTW